MNEKWLLDLVNRSGFPLQIKTEQIVKEFEKEHSWRVLYSEHSWHRNDRAGFIDLVLERKNFTEVIVIECKRVTDSHWTFLVPEENVRDTSFCKSCVLVIADGNLRYCDWHELCALPLTPQSGYCVTTIKDDKKGLMPENNAKKGFMLETIASDVVASTEALAWEEAQILTQKVFARRVYFSVIVTTAKLSVCYFDPSSISISNATLDGANFIEVPYLRFHKQLSSAPKVSASYTAKIASLGHLSQAKEHTVFVVNVENLKEFLVNFESEIGQISYLR